MACLVTLELGTRTALLLSAEIDKMSALATVLHNMAGEEKHKHSYCPEENL